MFAKRAFKRIFTAAFLFAAAVFSAENTGIEVRPNSTELIETEPKKPVTAVFRVTSKEHGAREFVSEIGLPDGWKLITQDFPFALQENQTEIKLVSFFVPQTATAGVYKVTYRVMDREFPSIQDYFQINVRVLPYKKLTAQILGIPRTVIAGEAYSLQFLISNESNIADSVIVSAASQERYPIKVLPSVLYLAKGESQKIEVVVETDSKIINITKDQVQIFVRFSKDKNLVAAHLASIDVIPRIIRVGDRFHRIPVEVVISEALENGQNIESGFQGEIKGEGALREGSDKRIHFGLRGPDVYQSSIYGRHDEYFLSLTSTNGGIHLGDRPFSLSPLTDQFRYGRGVEGQWLWHKFDLGGFYQKTRWYTPQIEEAAGSLKYKPNANTDVGFNYLSKKQAGRSDDIISVSGQATVYNTAIQVEAAFGEKNGRSRNGYYAKLNGQNSKMYYYFNLIYTDPLFQGYYQDTKFVSGGLSFDAKENIRLSAAYRYEKQKYMIDTLLYVAPLSQYLQIGVSYRFPDGTSLNLDGIRQSRKDRYPVPQFEYSEDYFKLYASKAFSTVGFNASLETGKAHNFKFDKTSASQRYSLNIYFKPNHSQTYRGYINYDDNQRYGGERNNRLTIGTNITLFFSERTQFYLNYQNNHSPENYYFDRNMFEVQLTQKLFEQHLLSVRARHTLLRNSLDRKETAIMLDYHINWGVPVGKKKSTGLVMGRLYDQVTSAPIQDVVIRISGSSAATDGQGRFIFPNLKPGAYYLWVDKAKIGLNWITVLPMPMEMLIHGGGKQEIDLAMVKSASFAGKVILFKAPSDSTNGSTGAIQHDNGQYAVVGILGGRNSLNDRLGLPNILIEMTREGETLRLVTDLQGCFNFEEVRPGIWNVKLYEYNLPEYHRFDKDSFTLELNPGESKTQTVNVVPKKRRIQILQDGGTVTEGAS